VPVRYPSYASCYTSTSMWRVAFRLLRTVGAINIRGQKSRCLNAATLMTVVTAPITAVVSSRSVNGSLTRIVCRRCFMICCRYFSAASYRVAFVENFHIEIMTSKYIQLNPEFIQIVFKTVFFSLSFHICKYKNIKIVFI